ncbi:hypothetical protein C8Q80DRAFT_76786 [Daedaleopsis nitida]|nr:hypothetical protein C8Q80DRAFT_76786 [Daedaleopsis nitida]
MRLSCQSEPLVSQNFKKDFSPARRRREDRGVLEPSSSAAQRDSDVSLAGELYLARIAYRLAAISPNLQSSNDQLLDRRVGRQHKRSAGRLAPSEDALRAFPVQERRAGAAICRHLCVRQLDPGGSRSDERDVSEWNAVYRSGRVMGTLPAVDGRTLPPCGKEPYLRDMDFPPGPPRDGLEYWRRRAWQSECTLSVPASSPSTTTSGVRQDSSYGEEPRAVACAVLCGWEPGGRLD